MALRDLKRYYLQVEQDWIEMVRCADEYLKAYKEGRLTDEQFADIEKDIEKIKTNYSQLSYVMFLLNQPKRKENVKKYNKENSLLLDTYTYLKADKESILDDNTYVLTKFKQHLKELRGE